jgi:hypothetical protein
MAGKEDANLEDGSTLAGKQKIHETTSVVAGEVVVPEFETQRTHKVANFNKPAKCGKSGCRLEASRRVTMHAEGPKNYCSQHWAKIEPNTHLYDKDTMMIIRPEYGEEIRGEDRVTRQRTRGEATAELFARTGIHIPVRGPGNPREVTDKDAEILPEDHVTPVINNAVVRGGRNLPALSEVDAKALMHKIKVGGAPKTQDQEIEDADEEMRRNPTTRTPNSFDEVEDLMKPGN